MSKIKVGILDDSVVCRAQLRAFLEAEGDIEIVCEAGNGEHAVELLTAHRPQLLVVDLSMPRVDGHATISHVMAHAPLPILVVTGEPLGPSRSAVFESIRRGALDLAEKPSQNDRSAQHDLRAAVRRLAKIPVVRHIAGKLQHRPPTVPQPSCFPPRTTGLAECLVVGIASSAGGPVALAGLVGALPRDLPAAVLLVQHLPETFMAAFADFVASRTSLKVSRVERSEPLLPGHVYLSVRDAHLVLEREGRVGLSATEPRSGHRPSADVLFESMARFAQARGAGVVLSGMGEDGARGLLALRQRGGLCLAQDRETAAVWGMPRAALELDAAERALPPLGLAGVISTWALASRQEAEP